MSSQSAWNGRGAALEIPVPEADLTLGRFVDEVARRYGGNESLVFGSRRYSYDDLRSHVRSAAKTLLALGVGKGTRIAVLLANTPEFIFITLSAASIGAVVVPMSTYAAPDERDYVLRHCDASLLVVQERLRSRRFVDELVDTHPALATGSPGGLADPAFPYLRRIVVVTPPEHQGDEDGATGCARVIPSIERWQDVERRGEDVSDELLQGVMDEVHPMDDAMIIYTSGTTAHPKAVLHIQRAPCVQSWRWMQQLGLGPDDRIWTSFPFFWTAGFSMSLGGTFVAGACLVLQDVVEPAAALAVMEQEKVTTVHAFPHTNAALADHPDVHRRDLSSLRNLPQDSPLRAVAGISTVAGDPRAAFGLSETFTIATSIPSDSPYEMRVATHGRPLPGMGIRIVNPDTGDPVGTNDIGEIAVRGVTLMRGYYKAFPEECFDDEGWFRTNDSGYLDEEGYLHWTGRLSNLVKTGGANVSPVEVENRAVELGLFGITTVVGVPHPTLGEAVVLCAVPLTGATVGADEVQSRLRPVLASYKVPRRVLYFSEEELSFTGTDKVRTALVRELAMRRLAASDSDQRWSAFLASALEVRSTEKVGIAADDVS